MSSLFFSPIFLLLLSFEGPTLYELCLFRGSLHFLITWHISYIFIVQPYIKYLRITYLIFSNINVCSWFLADLFFLFIVIIYWYRYLICITIYLPSYRVTLYLRNVMLCSLISMYDYHLLCYVEDEINLNWNRLKRLIFVYVLYGLWYSFAFIISQFNGELISFSHECLTSQK